MSDGEHRQAHPTKGPTEEVGPGQGREAIRSRW